MRVVVTGAAGFVGRAVCRLAGAAGHEVVAVVRHASSASRVVSGVSRVITAGDLADGLLPPSALVGADAVLHLAGRAHLLRDRAPDIDAAFRAVNVDGTLHVARSALAAGVPRFVFVSSVKVNGEGQHAAYRETDVPAPLDAYGRSKLEAERAVGALLRGTPTALTVVRPPLVYGPGAAGNMHRLRSLVRAGTFIPLPFGAVHNRRSLIFVDNLGSALLTAAAHPAAANELFLVADGVDLSTPELVQRIAAAMGRRVSMLPVPPGLLASVLRRLGRRADADRLLGSLTVDSSHIRTTLGWTPPCTLDEGLALTFAGGADT